MLELITVFIIDTGVLGGGDLSPWYLDNPSEVSLEHGTQVARVAMGVADGEPVCPEVRLYACDIGKDANKYLHCLSIAFLGQFNFVNISLTGPVYDGMEDLFLSQIVRSSIVTIAAGNEGYNLDDTNIYPASLAKNLTNTQVVSDYKRPFNRGSFVHHEDGSAPNLRGGLSYGSSFSAPRRLRKLLQDKCYNKEIRPNEVMCRSVSRQ